MSRSRHLVSVLAGALLLGLFANAPAAADPDPGQGSITGVVFEETNHDPVEGITVEVVVAGTANVLGSATTGPDGEWEVLHIPLGGDLTEQVDVVYVDADVQRNTDLEAYSTTVHEDLVLAENDGPLGEGTAETDVVLRRQAYIAGTVTQPGDAAVSGCVEVQTWLASGDHGFSDAVAGVAVEVAEDGKYLLRDVPLVPLGLVFADCDESEPAYVTEVHTNTPVVRDVNEDTVILLDAGEVRTIGAELSTTAPTGSHCAIAPFSDVGAANVFCDDIHWLAEMRIAGGYADGQFKSTNAVSRQAMAAFLHRLTVGAEEAPACEEAPFTDVPADSPFCAEIQWLVEEEIAEGFPDGTFHPTAPVSRQAMAAFLLRVETGGGPEATDCEESPFDDIAVTHPFCAHIDWLAGTGISDGYADDTFRPAAPVSRQAMAAFLHRLWNFIPEGL